MKPKLPKFEKPKALKALPKWTKNNEIPPIQSAAPPEWEQSMVDDKVALWAEALGSESLAKKLLKMVPKYPDATLPELVAIEWLERRQVDFVFQQWLLGGRASKGGQVVDLSVNLSSSVVILEVQGNYWHTRPGMVQRDAAQRLALLALTIYGKKVTAVVEVWESRLVTPTQSIRDDVMECALRGISKGK